MIAIATSAVGLKALSQIPAARPRDFPPAIVVVQHLDPRHRSLMADILSRRRTLPVKQAEENDKLRPGTARFLVRKPLALFIDEPDLRIFRWGVNVLIGRS